MASVLIIDNDPVCRNQLVEYLTQHSYRVHAADDISKVTLNPALSLVDLLVVDVNKEHHDSFEFLQHLRATIEIPVLIMSADLLTEADKVTALELGASDYIAKPIAIREFLARVRVALRENSNRRQSTRHMVYTFGHWKLSTRHRWLKDVSGDRVKLTAAELNLLIAFLQSPRQVLSREQLLLATRIHDQEIFDRSVDVLILRLRRKLGEDASSPQYIKTERRAGYVFDADVATEHSRKRIA
ncbi:response regulator [Rhizobium leguminosarum]|uniref:winged helix-turn-helix domain-containing protein n=1 Tax=Rhizobium leguminosarum TaxID=384 RepID=UPI001C93F095|nr:winged helix-turn-helix domain-containing protein [Rhizobium leguminosarum]MBY5775225.1 response regulator [Rhizobium leguminosarum]